MRQRASYAYSLSRRYSHWASFLFVPPLLTPLFALTLRVLPSDAPKAAFFIPEEVERFRPDFLKAIRV